MTLFSFRCEAERRNLKCPKGFFFRYSYRPTYRSVKSFAFLVEFYYENHRIMRVCYNGCTHISSPLHLFCCNALLDVPSTMICCYNDTNDHMTRYALSVGTHLVKPRFAMVTNSVVRQLAQETNSSDRPYHV